MNESLNLHNGINMFKEKSIPYFGSIHEEHPHETRVCYVYRALWEIHNQLMHPKLVQFYSSERVNP